MIDAGLYRRLFAELAAIGRGPGGWNRMAWGPGEDAARDVVPRRGRRARAGDRAGPGRQPVGDRAGRGPRARSTPSARIVDSVADGGAYDGALGVVAGLVAVEAARRAVARPRPLAVGAMVDEEGPRFGAAIFGSRALCGELDVDELLARIDPGGQRAARAGRAARRDGRDACARRRIPAARGLLDRGARRAGARLVDVPAPLGVATSLAARERWRCTLRGASDHAGTTAMAGRRDALVPAARAVLAAHDLALAEPGAVATVGPHQRAARARPTRCRARRA